MASVACTSLGSMKIDDRRPLAVDLFSGAGGLSLGLEQAGFEIAAAVEYDPIHAAVHEFNFPYGKTFCADVSKINGERIRAESEIGDREIQLVAGGPPCQGISMIGRRAIDDPRNGLLKEFVNRVLELNPRYFLMENVAGLMVGKHRALLDEVIDIFTRNGRYNIAQPVRVMQAADYGTPQSRKRTILLGSRADVSLPVYPEPLYTARKINGNKPNEQKRPFGPSVIEAIGDLPNIDDYPQLLEGDALENAELGAPSEYSSVLRGLRSDADDYSRPRPFDGASLTSSNRTAHTAKSIERFQATAPGSTETVSRFLRLHPDGISNTLRAGTASDRGAYTAPRPIHPIYPRVISVREAARLHGYPDWFRFHVTKWNGFRQIGNSVPAHLGRAVGRAILEADAIGPVMGQPVKLGSQELLRMNSGQAHEYFGLTSRVIPQRDRKVG